jgi:hypothetical protein
MKTRNKTLMKTKSNAVLHRASRGTTLDAAQLWRQVEDHLIPRLRLNVMERAVYFLLLRHSRLEGRRQCCFVISWLGKELRLCTTTARRAVRNLAGKGALRIVQRTYRGHLVEVFTPEEIGAGRPVPKVRPAVDLERVDFSAKKEWRDTIHRREAGRCFYCLREVPRPQRCIDHVVPEVQHGPGTYRNVVSCCLNCNVRKAGTNGADYLRRLYRLGRLNASELAERLRALRLLAAGRLKPVLPVPLALAKSKGTELREASARAPNTICPIR